jgi:hypothetical protein
MCTYAKGGGEQSPKHLASKRRRDWRASVGLVGGLLCALSAVVEKVVPACRRRRRPVAPLAAEPDAFSYVILLRVIWP